MILNLLDVAVGPMYLILGFFVILILALVVGIVIFAIKAIKKIKKDVE